MRAFDLLKLSTRMFRTRPSRTWLTILGIGVGIGAVLFLVSLGYGLQNILLEQIVSDEALLSLTVTNPPTEVITLNEENLKAISQIDNVKDVSPQAAFPSQITLGDLTGNIILRGVKSSYFKYAGIFPIAGRVFEEKEKDKVLISETILRLFNIEKPQTVLGEKVKFKVFAPVETEEGTEEIRLFEILGDYQIEGIVEGQQTSFVYFPLERLLEFLQISQYEQTQVRVQKSENLEEVREKIIEKGFQVTSLSETIEQANKIFRIVQIVLGLFGAIALFVSAIGMTNTMTVTLLERTNEIGIMRAIGASAKDIRALFLAESVIMGFLGGVVGTGIGVAGGEIFNWLVNILAKAFGGAVVDLFLYPLWFVISIILFSGIVGFFTGLFPAKRASRLDPLEALHYK